MTSSDLLQAWAPLSIEETHRLFAPMTVPWWIAGGLAIDLFLGRTTRDHADIDVEILRGDAPSIARQLGGWELFSAKDGQLEPWRADDAANAIWCRPHRDAPWALELLVADVVDGQWIYRREPSITCAVAELGYTTTDGVPYIRPEIQLLYKSKHLRPQNEADFRAVLPSLSPSARAWLAAALSAVDPAHVWLASLIDR